MMRARSVGPLVLRAPRRGLAQQAGQEAEAEKKGSVHVKVEEPWYKKFRFAEHIGLVSFVGVLCITYIKEAHERHKCEVEKNYYLRHDKKDLQQRLEDAKASLEESKKDYKLLQAQNMYLQARLAEVAGRKE